MSLDHKNFAEVNFDGLVGPTHNYAGLAIGNIASQNNINSESNPRDAALQGLKKMEKLASLGLKQAVLPPHPRPDISFLKRLGFSGTHANILKQALNEAPRLFSASYSASAMWTANAATVSPSPDCPNNKINFTPANLASLVHRSVEAHTTYNVLSKLFDNDSYFEVHRYLPHATELGDEGAANHTRFCNNYADPGVNLFVYGRSFNNTEFSVPKKFPARQTLEASMSVARQHGLDPRKTLFLQQNPDAIDAGVFHNDVCAVGNQNVLLCHEMAFVDQKNNLRVLQECCANNGIDLKIITVGSDELAISDAVSSYLFNSQLVSDSISKDMILIAPSECQTIKSAHFAINSILDNPDNPINQVHYVDCRQSMRNGGGPACLRLRVVLSDEQQKVINGNVILTTNLLQQLQNWVNEYYRDKIHFDDLLDPELVRESYEALDALTNILKLGSVYDFQK